MRQAASIQTRVDAAGGTQTRDRRRRDPLRILIADDQAQFRRAVRRHLSDQFPGAEFGEADNGLGALRRIGRQDWDLVLLDVNMPGASGLEVMKVLRGARPELPVVVLSVHCEDPYAARALADGAAGYVAKDTVDEELVTAIRNVLAGRKYVSASIARRLASTLAANSQPPQRELSLRR
jgi:DNA-binding NarL/FixJ family response regulator